MLRGAVKWRLLLLCLLTLFTLNLSFSSYVTGNVGLEWVREYGGGGDDILYSSIKTSDNCLLLVGESNSYTHDDMDVYVAKVDLNGNLLWNTTIGDDICDEDDAAYSVIEADNGYLITGKISTIDGIGDDVLLCKLNKNGNLMWKTHYGGNAWDWGNDILVTPNSLILIAGTTQDFYGSPYDVYLVKCSLNGDLVWKRKLDHSDHQYTSSIIQASNNQYLILGTSSVTTNTESDVFLLKVDDMGHEIWYKEYGREGKERASSIIQEGNSFTIIGTTDTGSYGRNDIYLLNVDSDGNKIWEKTIGSQYDDSGDNVCLHSGNTLITGNTFKDPGQSLNQYLITLTPDGNLSFNHTYGTVKYENAVNTHSIGSGTHYITGSKKQNNYDFLVTKISLSTNTLNIQSSVGETYGSGEYYLDASPVFGVEEEIIYEGTRIRYVFTGWTSTNVGGYNGNDNPTTLTIQNNITQTAQWQKQYYVEINKEGEGETNYINGWYNAGAHLTIESTSYGDNELIRWIGQGPGSYSGNDPEASIIVNGPIYQTAEFGIHPVWNVTVETEYGIVNGAGSYKEGEQATIGLTHDAVLLSPDERVVFDGWINPLGTGYSGSNIEASFTVEGNTKQVASWKKQYYVEFVPNEHGSVPESNWFDDGTAITLTSNPHRDYQFEYWEITSNSQTESYESNRYIVNSASTIEANIEPIPKPNYTLFFIVGSIGAIPVIAKSWIQIESSIKRKELAKKEYTNSRGTIHKKMLESAHPNLKHEIGKLLETITIQKNKKRKLEGDKQIELEKKASTYLFENYFTQIPGIGKKLKDRIRYQVFDGTLNSLYRCSWVEGIGEAKSSEISYWVRNQQSRLPTFIRNGFPGKIEIENRYDSEIRSVEKQIKAYQLKVEPLQSLESQLMSELSRLKRVEVSTFLKSFDGDKEASNIVTQYHLGVFPEWGRMPSWFKTCMEKYT